MDSVAAKKPVKLALKADGVYLQIDKSGGQKVSRSDIMALVESNKVRDIDFTAINDVFKKDDEIFEVLISLNKDILIKKEGIKVNISQDKLMATASFTSPVNSEDYMSFEQLKAYLVESKIEYGVDEADLRSIYTQREYDKPYVVAKGLAPVDGVNGYLVYHFDTQQKTYRPKMLDDGTVDYKQLSIIDVINEDDLLIEGIPAVEGSDGMSVMGKPIPHKLGKQFPPIHKTKNTKLSEDGRSLYAACSGQLVYKNGRVEVFPVLQISRNVDNSIGNIDFVGSVLIAGNVLTGFTVKAQGNIEIRGTMEGGTLVAGENITLVGGAQGVEKATIMAKGDVYAKYIDQCNVYAGGNIYTDFIVFSRIKCGSRIELAGKRGLLLGGKATVKEKITANTIGANMSTSTEIELGFMPDDFEKYKELTKELNETMNEYDMLKAKADHMETNIQNGLSLEAIEQLKAHNLYSISYFEEKIAELQNDIDDLTPDCTNEETCVVVSKMIHSGVKVSIGNATTVIFENNNACKLRNENGKIRIIDI